jgi:SAM-dependent methyltransferase
MSPVFASHYASAYDHLYAGKDYEAECEAILKLAGEALDTKSLRILDLGSGTGNHALPLHARGHQVIGVDRSEDMLALARAKARQAGADISFHLADIRKVDLGIEVDLALLMFAVLGYQTSNQDALDALASARRHLKTGGALIFDVWFGPAVLEQKPERRLRTIPIEGGEILRAVETSIDSLRQTCTVSYDLWTLKGRELAARSQERHEMRYFFPLELDLLLKLSGFQLTRLGKFEAPEQAPDANSWNVIVLAKAV